MASKPGRPGPMLGYKGGPFKYTQERANIFINSLTSLSGKVAACEAAGISYKTFQHWYRTLPEFQEMVDDAISESIAKGRQIAIAAIFKHMDKNWMAAAWWLERNFPDEYGRRDRIDMDVRQRKIIFQIGIDQDIKIDSEEAKKLLKEETKKYLPPNNGD